MAASPQQLLFRAKVKPQPRLLELMARIGYAANGTIHFVVGVLAVLVALGERRQATGSRGAIRTIASQPYGEVLLWITAGGLLAYAIWRFIQTFADPEREGSDLGGILRRTGYFFTALAHVGLAVFTMNMAMGASAASGDDSQVERELTAAALGQPLGQWIVLLAGFGVLIAACLQFHGAFAETFMRRLHGLTREQAAWTRRAGKLGFFARGVVFLLIGSFLIRAAAQADPNESRGLDGALQELARQPHGAWILGIVAAGLMLYGVFMMVTARYRHIRVAS